MSDIKQYGNSLSFGGIQSSDYYIWISGTGTFDAPERDVETITIPGRSGDLLIDGGRYKNVDITYPCFISKGFENRFDSFRAAMMAKSGQYLTLSDTYHPQEFRYAMFRGAVRPTTGPYNKAGRFDLVFNCKPQRYLTSGLAIQSLSASGTIENPTLFDALPNIQVYGSGNLTVNGYSMTIAANELPYINIDCEAMSAYWETTSANNLLSIGDFPVLSPGVNSITLGTGITLVQIQPRWYTL